MKWYELKPERVIPVLLGVLLTAAVFSRCGGGSNPPHPPSPLPTPTATPTPGSTMNLSIQGNRFFNGTTPLDMKAVVWCCAADSATAYGWPMTNEAGVREAKRLGANFLHIRLGPHTPRNEGNINSAFLPQPDGRADVAKYNPAFEQHVLNIVTLAGSLGMGVEVDFLDVWADRTRNSVWAGGNNINGVDESGCDVTRHPLNARRTSFVKHWADILKGYPNVTFQTGNESFLCNPTEDWEASFIAALRSAAPARLIGSNTRQSWSERRADYTTYHSSTEATPRAKPVVVNETKDEIVDPAAYCNAYKAAKAQSTYFMLWNGNRTKAQREVAAACWTSTTPTPPPADPGIKIDPGTGLPYLVCTVQPMPNVTCHCNKPSGPCPGDMVPDAIGGQMTGMLKAAPKAGVSGTSVVNRQAYYVSLLQAARTAGYCAKVQSLDEIWLRGSGKSYGFDIVTQPATGGMFIGSMKNVVQCFPSGV